MACNNCNSENFEPFAKVKCSFTKKPLSVVKCANCGLVYLSPRPDRNLGLSYFENAYSSAKGFESHTYYRDHEQFFLETEHLEDRKGTLKELADYLHDDGYLVIETSNIDSVDYLIYRNNCAYWHVDHLYYYSKKTLEDLLTRVDFKLANGSAKSAHSSKAPEY
jgi:hypothetical protein